MKRIILAGGSGFLGRALTKHFIAQQYEVIVLTRTPHGRHDGATEIGWDAKSLGGWATCLEGPECVINLVGKSVDCRYTKKNRKVIIASRVDSTRVIGEAVAQCKLPPRVWLNSSSATLYTNYVNRLV